MKRFDILFALGIAALIGDVIYKFSMTKILINQGEEIKLNHDYMEAQNMLNEITQKEITKLNKKVKKIEGSK